MQQSVKLGVREVKLEYLEVRALLEVEVDPLEEVPPGPDQQVEVVVHLDHSVQRVITSLNSWAQLLMTDIQVRDVVNFYFLTFTH